MLSRLHKIKAHNPPFAQVLQNLNQSLLCGYRTDQYPFLIVSRDWPLRLGRHICSTPLDRMAQCIFPSVVREKYHSFRAKAGKFQERIPAGLLSYILAQSTKKGGFQGLSQQWPTTEYGIHQMRPNNGLNPLPIMSKPSKKRPMGSCWPTPLQRDPADEQKENEPGPQKSTE